MRHEASLVTPVGPLTLTEEEGAITALDWTARGGAPATALLKEALAQLEAYFTRQLTKFSLPLAPPGSEFQKQVCDAMLAIPYGETRSYGEIARDLGVAAQPIGQACGGNPIPVLIPCHRVLGANGLGGFSGKGGVETKVELLKLEGAAGLLI